MITTRPHATRIQRARTMHETRQNNALKHPKHPQKTSAEPNSICLSGARRKIPSAEYTSDQIPRISGFRVEISVANFVNWSRLKTKNVTGNSTKQQIY